MFVSAGISHPDVDGMTSQAVRTKIRYEKTKNVTRLQPVFFIILARHAAERIVIELCTCVWEEGL